MIQDFELRISKLREELESGSDSAVHIESVKSAISGAELQIARLREQLEKKQ